MWLLNAVDDNVGLLQLAIPMTIKSITEDTFDVFKLITVCKLGNHLGFLEKRLKLRDYGYVAKGPPGPPAFSISVFVAKRTANEVFIFRSVCDTRVDTAIDINLIDSRQDRELMKDNPFRLEVEFVPEGFSHAIKDAAGHVARKFELKGPDIVSILVCNHKTSYFNFASDTSLPITCEKDVLMR